MQAHPIHKSRMDEQPASRQNLDQRNNVRLKESFNDWVTALSLRKIFNFSPNKWSKTGQTSKPFFGFSQRLWLEKGPLKADTKIKLGFYWEQSPNQLKECFHHFYLPTLKFFFIYEKQQCNILLVGKNNSYFWLKSSIHI